MKTPINVYVGYDAREHDAYNVCKYSIINHDKNDFVADIIPLKHRELRKCGLFYRRWIIDEDGQYWDELDGKPFSTEFSHTRFAIQEYATKVHNQKGWTLFVDCDFLFFHSIEELFECVDDKYAVMCVKFDWTPKEGARKMDGKIQSAYPRKLWSSMMLWNLDHPSNETMGYYKLNEATGSELHSFSWLKDEEIGEIAPEWNYVPGISKIEGIPSAVHFSEGGPWFKEYKDTEYADEWNEALLETYTAPTYNLGHKVFRKHYTKVP